MASVTLKVSTSVLKAKSQEILKQIKEIEKNWKLLYDCVDKSQNYWVGEASNQHRRSIADDKQDMEQVIKKLKEHPKDMLTMAGVYIETEKQATKIANALPKDVIV